jgi:hypothetical protein
MVEVPAETSTAHEAEDADDVEKIEVHVHLHRGNDAGSAGGRRRRRQSLPRLTGVLFDWQGHYDRILKRPSHPAPKRWSRFRKCSTCDAISPSVARRCLRCGAPRSPRLLTKLFAVIGLGSLAAVFALSAHLLGGSVPEQKPTAPLGNWSAPQDEFIVVQVPVTASPFSTTASASTSRDNLAVR